MYKLLSIITGHENNCKNIGEIMDDFEIERQLNKTRILSQYEAERVLLTNSSSASGAPSILLFTCGHGQPEEQKQEQKPEEQKNKACCCKSLRQCW